MKRIFVGILGIVMCLWAFSAMALPKGAVGRLGKGRIGKIGWGEREIAFSRLR